MMKYFCYALLVTAISVYSSWGSLNSGRGGSSVWRSTTGGGGGSYGGGSGGGGHK